MPPTVWCSQREPRRHGCRRQCATLCGPDGPHMNRNDHRRTPPRGARTMRAALSNVGPTRVEPHGCGGATTRPQAAHPTSDQPGPSRMDAARPHNPSTTRSVFAHAFDKSRRRQCATLCGPDGPHIDRNGHRRTSPRGARTMRAGLSNAGPAMVEPHGCGGAATTSQAAHPTRDQPGPSRMDAAPAPPPIELPTRVRAPLRQRIPVAPHVPRYTAKSRDSVAPGDNSSRSYF